MAGEMRRNPLTGQWVIYALSRGQRPRDVSAHPHRPLERPRFAPQCPFCSGNEAMLPGIVWQWPDDPERGWQVRVVPNKYPALSRPARWGEPVRELGANGPPPRRREGLQLAADAVGRHEVIVETPAHDCDLPDLTAEEMVAVVRAYRRRYCELLAEPGHQRVVVFRNHGVRAGTSLSHPHAQVMALPLVPAAMRDREARSRDYWDHYGRCLMCDLIAEELSQGDRLVLADDAWAAFVPYAAASPMELWVAPRAHRADFGEIAGAAEGGLAATLQAVLGRLRVAGTDPDYNLVIHTFPCAGGCAAYLHWYIEIRPRTTIPAGLEIATGMAICPTMPEDDAALLRDAAWPEDGA